MALAPNVVTGYALGVLSIAILMTKGSFIYIRPSRPTTKHSLSTKFLEFSPSVLSFCWAAYHVTCELTLATSLDPTCDELDQMMNPDIGGIGARVGIYAPQITTMISMGMGHWHNKENGVKETCIVNLIVLASLTLNTLKGFYKSLHVTEILVACYSIDGVHAAITMAFAEKRTLASRWLISISVLTQLSAKITVAVAVGHLPSVERGLDCSIRIPFYGDMFYAYSWNPATLWWYLAFRSLNWSFAAYTALSHTLLFDEAEKNSRIERELKKQQHNSPTDLEKGSLPLDFDLLPSSSFLIWIEYAWPCLDSILNIELLLRSLNLGANDRWKDWGQSATIVLSTGSTLHWFYMMYHYRPFQKGRVLLSLSQQREGAKKHDMQAARTRTRVLDEEYLVTLTSMANLASTYRNQGRWEDAEKLEVQVMETRKRLLGDEHPDTLTSMANLASTYRNQGRWDDAEKLEVQVMETSKTKLGVEHPDTLISMANLASTYRNQGRWDDAEKLEVQVVKMSKRMLGGEHPDTLASMINLASTYRNQGRWTKAEELEVQVVEMSKRVLGGEHPVTLTSMANLASTYRNQGHWEDAEKLEVQVVEMRKRMLGGEHPDTLTSMGNLASTYRNQGRWEDAEKLEVQVVEMRKRMLGGEHPATLTSMGNLASIYRNQGRWDAAEKLEVQVMETSKTKLGVDHPSTLTSMANLALTYRNQGRWDDAEELEVQVMETSKTRLGEDHPDTLTSMANLASTYWNQGRWDDAEKLEVQVMETRKRMLGDKHPDTLTSMSNLAYTLQSQSRHEEAFALMEASFHLRQQVLGEQHPDTQSSLDTLNGWRVDLREGHL